jgi:hypothetical protein
MTKTRINSVGKHSKSLRSVIPHWIVEQMELSKDNSLVWSIEWDSETGKRQIMVNKVIE